MSVAHTRRARWAAAAACVSALVLTGARGADDGGAGPTAAPSAVPDAGLAGRSDVFGLVETAGSAGLVRFAPARKVQPGGPETVRPADVRPYRPVRLAPDAVIRASAPIANDGVTDWVRGVRLSPEDFRTLLLQAEERLRPLPARAHMFEVWFDDRGRITRMQHYFSP